MKEEHIRPKDLIEEKEKLRMEDINELLLNKSNFVNVLCPACESDNHIKVFKKQGFNYVKCKDCKTLFINPRPTLEMLVNYYENSRFIKYWNDYIYPTTEEPRRECIFIPRAKRVVELCKDRNVDTKTLLDVGAGYGTFCEEIGRLNYFQKIIAVEPSFGLAESCRKKNIEVLEIPIEKVTMREVSVITNFELIEHLFWPKDFLISCNKVLRDDGLLILTTPNLLGFDLLVLGKLANGITGPNHINYFHLDSLKILLKKTGFEIVEKLTPGKLDSELVRSKILNGELDVSQHPFLNYILVEKWDSVGHRFQDFLAQNNLSSHLWVVARKI